MGAGKSTVGRLVAHRLGRPFVDSDDAITQRTGRTPREIFAVEGEAAFRTVEHEVIAQLVAVAEDSGAARVVAVGGGAVEDQRTRAALRGAHIVYLEVSHAGALERVGGDPDRPMLARPDLEAVHARRAAEYRQVADVTIVTDDRSVAEVAQDVLSAVAPGQDRGSPPHLVQ
jgi:shikimate kinase